MSVSFSVCLSNELMFFFFKKRKDKSNFSMLPFAVSNNRTTNRKQGVDEHIYDVLDLCMLACNFPLAFSNGDQEAIGATDMRFVCLLFQKESFLFL